MSPWSFKLLYDGECPLCVREARWLQRLDRRHRLAFEDITSPGFNPVPYGVTQSELMAVIHGVFPDGRVVRRMAVFREAYRVVGLGWLLAPTGWPVLRTLCDGLYTAFARHRLRIGRLLGRSCSTGSCRRP